MKNLKTFFTVTALATVLATSSFAAEEKYFIEPSHTAVVWTASHFGFSNSSGKFTDISGEIIFDEKNPAKSSVNVTIKTASVVTGLAKFDEHLRSKDFFD